MFQNHHKPSIAEAVSANGNSFNLSSSFSPHLDLELLGFSSSLMSMRDFSAGAPHPPLGGPF
jgi:hypothetical protein